MVLHWSLSDSKSPQVSRTRLTILAVLSNAVVWRVSTRPPISKSSRPFNNPLVIVPNTPITIGTNVTFMFHSFFNSLARSRFWYFFSLSFRIILCIIIIIPLRVVPTRISRWSSTRVRVTASLLKSPGLFSVIWPILIMLSLGWSLIHIYQPPPLGQDMIQGQFLSGV